MKRASCLFWSLFSLTAFAATAAAGPTDKPAAKAPADKAEAHQCAPGEKTAQGDKAAPGDKAANKAAPPSTAPGRFGAPLSDKPAMDAGALLAQTGKWDDKDVKVKGQVGAVCQRKGCWMTLGTGEPGQKTVRVSFKDYGFFVPTDCVGKQAVVEGHFKVTTMSQAEAQHHADDAAAAGGKAKKVDGPQQTLALVATGVELK